VDTWRCNESTPKNVLKSLVEHQPMDVGKKIEKAKVLARFYRYGEILSKKTI
jgi:hypothetical protein